MAHISVISPVYGCKNCLNELYARLSETMKDITPDFELILVNDGSPDGAWELIMDLASMDHRVKGINFSRNFGQHYAITAGLEHCTGEWIVLMDCDLQDQPEEIIKLYKVAIEGKDIVMGRREIRKDIFLRRIGSKLFHKTFNYLTGTKVDYTVASFRIVSRRVVDSYLKLREYHRFINLNMSWLGFDAEYVNIKHSQRFSGKSSYNFRKLLNLTINAILSFSDKPLRLTIKFGFTLALLSSLFILYKVIINLVWGTTALGWSSLIASIFFSTGIIVSILGIIGLYLGRIFEEVKNRPLYIIKETKNL